MILQFPKCYNYRNLPYQYGRLLIELTVSDNYSEFNQIEPIGVKYICHYIIEELGSANIRHDMYGIDFYNGMSLCSSFIYSKKIYL